MGTLESGRMVPQAHCRSLLPSYLWPQAPSAAGDLSCVCDCSWVVCGRGLSCCGQKAGTAHTHSTVSTILSSLFQSTHL